MKEENVGIVLTDEEIEELMRDLPHLLREFYCDADKEDKE